MVKLLARGGIGQVMQAIDTELNREVAVKEIQSQLVDDIAVRERFLREVRLPVNWNIPVSYRVWLGQRRTGTTVLRYAPGSWSEFARGH